MDFQEIEKGFPEEILEFCYYRKGKNSVPVFPYVVAVTGHRKFAKASCSSLPGYNRATIKKAFRNELESVAKKWNETSKSYAPIILLTGMADGADQIAAEAGLEIDKSLNVKVVAVLPMEREIFRLTVENKERFDNLMKRVHYSFALPVDSKTLENNEEAKLKEVDKPETEEIRRRQYCRLAEFLAVHSHVLFAFWDGIDDKKQGGTADVVRLKLLGADSGDQDSFLTRSSVGPVVQFLTPRHNDANRAEPCSRRLKFNEIPVFFWARNDLWQTDKSWRPFPDRSKMTEVRRLKRYAAEEPGVVDVLEKLGRINLDAVECYEELKPGLQESEGYLWEGKKFPKEFLDAGTRILVEHYCVTDKLALLFQKKSQNIGKPFAKLEKWFGKDEKTKKFKVNGYPLLIAAIGCITLILDCLWKFQRGLCGGNRSLLVCWLTFAVYFVIVLYTGRVVRKASRENFLYLYFRCRAAAEALRVQIFWRIAEMNDCVSSFYRSHQVDNSEWLRATINGLDVLLPEPEPKGDKSRIKDRLVFVRDVWIRGQLVFYEKNIGKRRNNLNEWWDSKWYMRGLYLVIIVLPLKDLVFDPVLAGEWKIFPSEFWRYPIGLCYVLVTLMTTYFAYQTVRRQILCHKQEADRYERMIFPYDRAVWLTQRTEGLLKQTEETVRDEDKRALEKIGGDPVEYWRKIFRQSGAEAIAENADWLLTVGERKLTLPR